MIGEWLVKPHHDKAGALLGFRVERHVLRSIEVAGYYFMEDYDLPPEGVQELALARAHELNQGGKIDD